MAAAASCKWGPRHFANDPKLICEVMDQPPAGVDWDRYALRDLERAASRRSRGASTGGLCKVGRRGGLFSARRARTRIPLQAQDGAM